MQIRIATEADAGVLAAIEAACFPPAEAATPQQLAQRLAAYGSHFFVAEKDGEAIGFIDGPVIATKTLTDEMYADTACHSEQNPYQSVFGLNTLPAFRRRGVAAGLMQALLAQAKEQGRQGAVLTCKAALVPYYEKFGYVCQGVSASVHGGAVWYDMLLIFAQEESKR